MDRVERYNQIHDVARELSYLADFYQNKNVFSDEDLRSRRKEIKKVKQEIFKIINLCEADVVALEKISPDSFDGKLNAIALKLKEYGNEEGQDGCVESAEDFFNGMNDVLNYLEDKNEINAERMIDAITTNIDILDKIKGLPKSIVDLNAFVKLTDRVDNQKKTINLLEATLIKFIEVRGTLVIWIDCIGENVNLAKILCRSIKSKFPYIRFKLAITNEGFNRRWTGEQLSDFAELVRYVDAIESTDKFNSDFVKDSIENKNNFLMHSCKLCCFVTKDKSNDFIDKCRCNNRMVFLIGESVVRYR